MNKKKYYLLRTVDGSIVKFASDSDIEYLRKYRWRLQDGHLIFVRELEGGEDDWVEEVSGTDGEVARKILELSKSRR